MIECRFNIAASTLSLCLNRVHIGLIAAHAVMSKEATPDLVMFWVKDIDDTGHMKVAIKRDNEPAIKALAGRATELRSPPPTVFEH